MKNIEISNNTNIINRNLEEYYNLLRTNIQFCGKDIKTILVTSVSKNEGKSVVSINLCLSLAKLGLKILYIDADLRKSLFASRFLRGHKVVGLTDYLSGMVEADDILYHTEFPSFQVLPSGHRAPSPTELLQSESFSKSIDDLKDLYDYIIIDTSPIGLVVDPLIISKVCDASVLVVKSGEDKSRDVQKAVNDLKLESKFLGVILNMMKFNNIYGKYGQYGNY